MLEDILQRVKQSKEMDSAWIELVGEQDPDAICVVCTEKDKASILQVMTAIKADVQECFENHEDAVTIDPMWQKVLKKLGYFQEISEKFSNLTMTLDETKSTVMLKGPRDQSNTAAKHLMELLGTAHAEVQEDIFSPGCEFDIFAYPEMCDYIDNSIIKLPFVWIPNCQTMKIHLFSKKSEQIMGMDKFIKGCIKERPYPLTKDQSVCCPRIARSLEELKKKHKGKIVIDQSHTGIILTAADDIFESVDAVILEIISIETDNVQSAHVTEKHVKRDGHLVNKPENKDSENQRKTEDSLQSKRDVTSEQNTKKPEGLKSESNVNFDQLEVMVQPESKVKPNSDGIGTIKDRKKSNNLARETNVRKPPPGKGPLLSGKSSAQKRNQDLQCDDALAKKAGCLESEEDEASPGTETPCQKEPSSDKWHGSTRVEVDAADDCVICMCPMTNPRTLPCGHSFCADCIDWHFKHKPVCVVCGKILGIFTGDQPEDGRMDVSASKWQLAGYEGHDSICITYTFSAGRQGPSHPSPGKFYASMARTAYLPDIPEGRTVCRMLQLAFERRLVFTIGTSRTTGKDGLIWNDIHHKTNRIPGTLFGYPDPDYLSRVKDELAAKGISEADITPEGIGSLQYST